MTDEELKLLSIDLERIAANVYACAVSWEPEARLIGNVRAGDIAKLALHAVDPLRELDRLRAENRRLVELCKETLMCSVPGWLRDKLRAAIEGK